MPTSVKAREQGGLYPSIAVSDAFNVAGHAFAAALAREKGNTMAAIGFSTVALAGTVGVFRFGFSESMFAAANGYLADVAAFIGLPLVGHSIMQLYSGSLPGALKTISSQNPVAFVVALSCFEAMTRGLTEQQREFAKVLTNLTLFVGPTAFIAYQTNNMDYLVGIVIFAMAGVVITADRHRYILGVRCENWFHYCIAIAAVFLAQGL